MNYDHRLSSVKKQPPSNQKSSSKKKASQSIKSSEQKTGYSHGLPTVKKPIQRSRSKEKMKKKVSENVVRDVEVEDVD